MSETSELVNPFIRWCNGIPGVWARRIHSGKVAVRRGWLHLGSEGAPDALWMVDGRSYLTEFKKPGERPTAAQLKEHARIRRAGSVVYTRDDIELAKEDVRSAIFVLQGRR